MCFCSDSECALSLGTTERICPADSEVDMITESWKPPYSTQGIFLFADFVQLRLAKVRIAQLLEVELSSECQAALR